MPICYICQVALDQSITGVVTIIEYDNVLQRNGGQVTQNMLKKWDFSNQEYSKNIKSPVREREENTGMGRRQETAECRAADMVSVIYIFLIIFCSTLLGVL